MKYAIGPFSLCPLFVCTSCPSSMIWALEPTAKQITVSWFVRYSHAHTSCVLDCSATAVPPDQRHTGHSPVQAFLQRFLRAAHVATTMEYQCLEALARYILELSLLDYSMLRHRCSTVAASAILLARALIVHIPPESSTEMSNATRKHVLWTRTLEQYAFHTARELEDCVRQLHRTLLTVTNKSKKQPFVCTKYKHSKWGKVATLPLLDELPDSMFERFAWFSVPASYLSHVNV